MNAVSQLPAGAVPAFIGLLLVIAVLIEPYIIRRQVPQRLWARLRGKPPPPLPESGGVAIEGAQTRGTMASDKALAATGFGSSWRGATRSRSSWPSALWFVGLSLRPDYWWNLPNSFAILLNFTEVALLAIGAHLCHRQWRHRPVGRRGSGAGGQRRRLLPQGAGHRSGGAQSSSACSPAAPAGVINALLTVGFGLSAFIATLGMYYIARGLAAWIVAGQQLTGFPEGFNLLGRKIVDIFAVFRHRAAVGHARAPSPGGQRADALDVPHRHHRRHHSRLHARSARRSTRPAATAAPPTMPASTPGACASSRWRSRASARQWRA